MNWPDAIGGLIPVLGTLGGLLAGSLLEQRRVRLAFQREKLDRDTVLLRAKLEDLYLEVGEMDRSITTFYLNVVQLVGSGQVVPKQNVKGNATKVSMLVGIYAPKLGPELEALNHALMGFAKAFGDFMSNPTAANHDGIVKLTASVMKVSPVAHRLQERVAEAAAKTLTTIST
jgi:hypothetical protein